jgi:hypothetical protein
MVDTPASVDALRPVGLLGFPRSLPITREAGPVLVELSVMGQRYRAVLEAEASAGGYPSCQD